MYRSHLRLPRQRRKRQKVSSVKDFKDENISSLSLIFGKQVVLLVKIQNLYLQFSPNLLVTEWNLFSQVWLVCGDILRRLKYCMRNKDDCSMDFIETVSLHINILFHLPNSYNIFLAQKRWSDQPNTLSGIWFIK